MQKGFTLIELLLVIAMLAILSYLAMPLSFSFYRSQAVESARSELIETLTRARHNALLQKGDSQYGVYIDDLSGTGNLSSFTLYKGTDHLNNNIDFDEVYIQTPNLTITASGTADLLSGDINFTKLTGTTSATGTITITHSSGNESRSVIIDSFGNAYKE